MSNNVSFIGQNLAKQDGEVYYLEHFIDQQEATKLHAKLLKELDWQEEQITLYGKAITVPRLVCWYGDPAAEYRYSGVLHRPIPWTSTLLELKQQIESVSQHSFNSVLANLYRDGNDSMGWHADKEKELGKNPYIASLSLGESRLFRLRHNKTKAIFNLELSNGSLLLLGGSLQHHWQHCVPKTREFKRPRINLTFRNIFSIKE